MRIPIFHLDNKEDYKTEYLKMMKVLNSKCIVFDKTEYSYFDFVNSHLFHNWKFRGTYLDCYEYLDSIGVNPKNKKISISSFLNLIEFILNIQLLIDNIKHYSEKTKYSIKASSVIKHNIPIILDQLGYQAYSLEDRILILEKEIDYDDILSILPNDIKNLCLTYRSINNNGIKTKRMILYKLYEYLNKDSEKYKSYNSTVFSSIKTIINKMGIVGEMDKKYQNLSNYKIRKYYDNCFEMILYLVNTENILKYRDEIRSII